MKNPKTIQGVKRLDKAYETYQRALLKHKVVSLGELQGFIFGLIRQTKHEIQNTQAGKREHLYNRKQTLWYMMNMCKMIREDIEFDTNNFFEKCDELFADTENNTIFEEQI